MVGKLTDSSGETTWATIPSFPRYEASTAGEVRRIGATHPKTPTPTNDGYLAVAVVGEDGPRTRLVHRLVAETFIGDITGLVVHHKNGCGMDPRLENLEVMSQADNVRRSYADGTAGTLRGERRPEVWGRGQLTAQQVMTLRRAKASGKRGVIAELARAYEVDYGVAYAAASGTNYDYIGETSLETDLLRQECTAVKDARKVVARLNRAKAARAANPRHTPPAAAASVRPRFTASKKESK
jgi:hypothetical protein